MDLMEEAIADRCRPLQEYGLPSTLLMASALSVQTTASTFFWCQIIEAFIVTYFQM